jgi:hypothetical protein
MILTEYIHDIFIARCKDTGERPKKEEASQFKKYVQSKCTGSSFQLRESRIGPLAAAAIGKVLRSSHHITKLDLYGNGTYFTLFSTLLSNVTYIVV